MCKGHPHAALMVEYAKDAAESPTPWLGWEFKWEDNKRWQDLSKHPEWKVEAQYRRKVKTVTINGVELEDTRLTGPKTGEVYVECVAVADWYYTRCGEYISTGEWNIFISRGIAHSTREGAIAFAKARVAGTIQSL